MSKRMMWVLVAGLLAAFPAAARSDSDAWQAELTRLRDAAASHPILPAEDAAGAVDGVIRGRFSFHTGQDTNAFWQSIWARSSRCPES